MTLILPFNIFWIRKFDLNLVNRELCKSKPVSSSMLFHNHSCAGVLVDEGTTAILALIKAKM